MHPLIKNALAFIVGLIMSVVAISAIQSLGHSVYPVSKLNPTQSIGLLLFVEASYLFGSMLGGFCTAKLAATYRMELVMGLGVLLTVFGVQNLIAMPHPLWFAVLSTCTYLPAAYYGAKLVGENESPFV